MQYIQYNKKSKYYVLKLPENESESIDELNLLASEADIEMYWIRYFNNHHNTHILYKQLLENRRDFIYLAERHKLLSARDHKLQFTLADECILDLIRDGYMLKGEIMND